MHIFIDESGTFSGVGKKVSISAVGALSLPSGGLNNLEQDYLNLRRDLPKDKNEVKGRQLSETHIKRVIRLLFEHDAVFHCAAIDMGNHTANDLLTHQERQIEAVSANITDKHTPELRASVKDMQALMKKFSSQLYVQSIVTFQVIHRVINESCLYYVQRSPIELGSFHWVIDAKNSSDPITPWERWWSMFVMPIIQTMTVREPFIALKGADYSHFQRFIMPRPDWIPAAEFKSETSDTFNAKTIMTEDFRFSDKPEPGLELVDIVTNATRRVLLGKLSPEVHVFLRRIMIHRRDEHYINMLALHRREKPKYRPYYPVLMDFKSHGRSMLTN